MRNKSIKIVNNSAVGYNSLITTGDWSYIMWLAILIISVAALLLGIIYMMFAVSHVSFIQKLAKKRRGLSLFYAFILIVIFLTVMSFITTLINSVVIFLHQILFTMLFSLLGRILKKLFNKSFPSGFKVYFAFITCTVYLLVAFFLCKNVWLEHYQLQTDKEVGSIKVAVFADSHLGTTFDGDGFEKLMKEIEKQSPDVLLIPGDFIDDGTTKEDLEKACRALGNIKTRYGVFFAYGNHDRGYYRGESADFHEADMIKAMEDNGITILKDDYVLIDNRFYIVGREDAYSKDRKDINSLLKDLDTDKYIIVLDHQPNDYYNEAASSADLVLSGHTHGGQLFPLTFIGELIGANDRTYGYERRNNTDFIVTSGISDWAIIFKTGTKSEYLIIDIE
jgi:Predicted phosphohydrolases